MTKTRQVRNVLIHNKLICSAFNPQNILSTWLQKASFHVNSVFIFVLLCNSRENIRTSSFIIMHIN